MIAENLLLQVDQEGHRQLLIDEIIDHRRLTDAIPKEHGTYLTSSGARRKKQTTRGWELCIQWRDGSSNWVALKDIMNSFPIEAAEYTVNNQLQDEPAFSWWVPHTIKERKSTCGKFLISLRCYP